MNLYNYPIAPMLIALLIPLIYSYKWKRESLKQIWIVSLCCILIVIVYPLVYFLQNIEVNLGYFLGKLIIFTIMPLIIILYLEEWKVKETLFKLGLRRQNLWKSIVLGIGALMLTVTIALAIFWGQKVTISTDWNVIMFFDAFNEEFLFRGVLLIYLWKITDIKIAYSTSILAFILAHSQYYTVTLMVELISTVAQGVLLAIIAHKTKNIIGPWISHGLTRAIPQIVRAVLF